MESPFPKSPSPAPTTIPRYRQPDGSYRGRDHEFRAWYRSQPGRARRALLRAHVRRRSPEEQHHAQEFAWAVMTLTFFPLVMIGFVVTCFLTAAEPPCHPLLALGGVLAYVGFCLWCGLRTLRKGGWRELREIVWFHWWP